MGSDLGRDYGGGWRGAEDIGHRTWDIGHGTWDMGHGTWDIRHRT